MATIPIHNPVVPFLGQIPGGFRPGAMIRIKGVMHEFGTRVNFNLQTGPALAPRDDVALHLSIRPDHQCIVRNSLENNNYGTEERFGGCPIQYSQPFELNIMADHATYKIAINGVHFCHFNHRVALSRVQFIAAGEGCTLHFIGLEGAGAPPPSSVFPPSAPGYPMPGPYPGQQRPGQHAPAYPPAGGVAVYPHAPPVPPPPPPYSPAPAYPIHHPNQHATPYGLLSAPPQPIFMEKSVKSESLSEKSKNFIKNAKTFFDKPHSNPHMASTMYSQPAASQNYQPQSNLYPHLNPAYPSPHHNQPPPPMPMNQAFVNAPAHVTHPHYNANNQQHLYNSSAGSSTHFNSVHDKKKKNKKALGIAAGVGAGLGALGLGGYAITRAIKGRKSSSSDSD